MSNIIKLNQIQKRDLLTLQEQLEVAEAENTSSKSVIERLTQQLDQVQKTNQALGKQLNDTWLRLCDAKREMAELKRPEPQSGIETLDEAITKFKSLQSPLKVVDRSVAFDYLNEYTDGVVGCNHIYYQIGKSIYVVYYTLSDDAKFTILEVREEI